MALPGVTGPAAPPARRQRRLANPVIEEFVDQIVGGAISPGSPLPKEAALCEHFEVSRSVIREVLKLLEEKGLVRVLNGKGAWSTERDAWNLLDPLVLSACVRHDANQKFLSELITVRRTLEAEMAATAATSITDEQLAEIEVVVDELGRAMNDVSRYIVLDFQFHDAVMRASHNELARTIVLAIIERANAYPRYGSADLGHVHRSQPGHVALFEALRAHDPVAAAEAIHRHVIADPETAPTT